MLQINKKDKAIDIFDNIPTISDLLVPDVLEENKDYTYLGYNKYSRHFVLTVFPEDVWVGWLDDIFSIGNINISTKIEPTSNADVISQLTRKLVQKQSQYETYSKQGNIAPLPELEKEIQDLSELRSLIQTNQDKLYFVNVFITLNAKNLQELNEKTLIIESELNKKTAQLRCMIFRQLEGYQNMLPLGKKAIYGYERNFTAGGVATLIPVSNANLSHNQGVFVGRNLSSNAPLYIDNFAGPPTLTNPHACIFGTSGGGKSVALKTISARSILNGVSTFFIDPEGEYTKLTNSLGGQVVKISPGETAGINPFELEIDKKGNKEFINILDKISEIRSLFATISRYHRGKTLKVNEITEIEIVVKQIYEERGINTDVNSLYEKHGGKLKNGKYVVGKLKKKMPTLSDFQAKVEERGKCKELAELLNTFLKR